MATWMNVRDYLLSNYPCDASGDDGLTVTFSTGEGRSQEIHVRPAGPAPGETTWADFQTPLGRLEEFDVGAALARTASFEVGGLSLMGDRVTLRTCVPLENLDRNEIDDPLHRLLTIGDLLRRELTGKDES
ncbi:MAG TPA: hypothetical protein GXZ45_05060 [Propionibacterium sp.]|nr:hypothetical protein [Propionibacterium sp.]